MTDLQKCHAKVTSLDFRGRGRLEALGEYPVRLRPLPKVTPGDVIACTYDSEGHVTDWQLVEAGPERTPAGAGCFQDPHCPGCQWRSLSLEAQRTHRQRAWQRALTRLGGEDALQDTRWRPTMEAVASDGYRARAVGRWFETQSVIGMRNLGGGQAVNLAQCPAQTLRAQRVLENTAHVLRVCGVVAYDEERPDTLHGLYYVTVDAPDLERVARMMFVTPSAPDARLLCAVKMLETVDQNLSIWHGKISLRDPVMPHRNLTHLGGPAVMNISNQQGQTLRASPGAWTSTSPQNAAIVWDALLGEVSAEQRFQGTPLLEIGCGVGVHSFALAMHSPAGFIGLDSSREAILDAQHNASALGVDPSHTQFRVGVADRAVRRIIAAGTRAERVILHGMREPFGDRLCGALPALGARIIWYVTPSVFALGEDLRALHAAGFKLKSVQPLDTMPHTYHMMALAILERPASA